MKAINIYSLTRISDAAQLSRLERQMSGRSGHLKIKSWETEGLRAFCSRLSECCEDAASLKFYYSFTMPKLGKEFDLLRRLHALAHGLNAKAERHPCKLGQDNPAFLPAVKLLHEPHVQLYQVFRSRIQVYDVPSGDPMFTQLVLNARRRNGLKLPDAIIAATARANHLSVLTADDHFKKLKSPWKVRFYKTEQDNSKMKGTTLIH